LKYIKRMTSV